jgi:hypothetical protein
MSAAVPGIRTHWPLKITLKVKTRTESVAHKQNRASRLYFDQYYKAYYEIYASSVCALNAKVTERFNGIEISDPASYSNYSGLQ